MDNARKTILFIVVIEVLIEWVQGKTDIDTELISAIDALGLDSTRILYSLPPLQAIQEVCAEFSKIQVTQEEIEGLPDEPDFGYMQSRLNE